MENNDEPIIDLKSQPSIYCEKCDSLFFEEVTMIKRVSRLLTGASQDTIVPFPTYRCGDCGHVNDEFKLF